MILALVGVGKSIRNAVEQITDKGDNMIEFEEYKIEIEELKDIIKEMGVSL